MSSYLPRVADKELNMQLDGFGAMLIIGQKWCGKTMTGEQRSNKPF